jgi:hypothetical protein
MDVQQAVGILIVMLVLSAVFFIGLAFEAWIIVRTLKEMHESKTKSKDSDIHKPD